MIRFRSFLSFGGLALLSLPLYHCGSGDDAGDATNSDGVDYSGNVIAYPQGTKTPGVTISAGDRTTVSDDVGNFVFKVPTETPFYLKAHKDGYDDVWREEAKLIGSFQGGTIPLTESAIAATWRSPDQDVNLGSVVIFVWTGPTDTPSCADTTGAIISFDPPGDAKIGYIQGDGKTPASSYVKGGWAYAYNVPLGPTKITVTHPNCQQIPYPYKFDANMYFTGNLTVVPASQAQLEAFPGMTAHGEPLYP